MHLSPDTDTGEEVSELVEYLKDHELSMGLRSENGETCSMGAINLVFRGELSDEALPGMSVVVWRWIVRVQDAYPSSMRNSPEWKALLPVAAVSPKSKEPAQIKLLLEVVFEEAIVLLNTPRLNGYQHEWEGMVREKNLLHVNRVLRALAENRRYDKAFRVATYLKDCLNAYSNYLKASKPEYIAAAAADPDRAKLHMSHTHLLDLIASNLVATAVLLRVPGSENSDSMPVRILSQLLQVEEHE